MARVYVIASNEDKAEARRAMKILRKNNHVVHDWTDMNGKRMSMLKVENDFNELMNSDIAIVINAGRVTPSKYIEIGACKAEQKDIIFIGEPLGVLSRFGLLANSVEEAVAIIS